MKNAQYLELIRRLEAIERSLAELKKKPVSAPWYPTYPWYPTWPPNYPFVTYGTSAPDNTGKPIDQGHWSTWTKNFHVKYATVVDQDGDALGVGELA